MRYQSSRAEHVRHHGQQVNTDLRAALTRACIRHFPCVADPAWQSPSTRTSGLSPTRPRHSEAQAPRFLPSRHATTSRQRVRCVIACICSHAARQRYISHVVLRRPSLLTTILPQIAKPRTTETVSFNVHVLCVLVVQKRAFSPPAPGNLSSILRSVTSSIFLSS